MACFGQSAYLCALLEVVSGGLTKPAYAGLKCTRLMSGCVHTRQTLQTGLKCARLMSGCVHKIRDTTDWVKAGCTHLMSGCVHTRQKHYRLG